MIRRSETAGRWAQLVARSLLAGAGAGMLAGAMLFFVFGFIGVTGGSLGTRLGNGWEAAYEVGIARGARVGLGIAIGLAVSSLLWMALTTRFEPSRARPWLAVTAALIVVVANLVVGRLRVWDEIGILTVVAMSILTGFAVWIVAPWVLRSLE